jgi:predicted Zn-dependent protease
MTTQSLKSATQLAAEGRFEEARRIAEQRVRRAPNDPQGWLVLAEVTDDLAYAVRCMEHVVRLRPHDQRALQKMHDLRARLEDEDMSTLYTQFDTIAAAGPQTKDDMLNLMGALAAGLLMGVVGTLMTIQLLGPLY